jgi:hypothetical protein
VDLIVVLGFGGTPRQADLASMAAQVFGAYREYYVALVVGTESGNGDEYSGTPIALPIPLGSPVDVTIRVGDGLFIGGPAGEELQQLLIALYGCQW